MKFLIHSNGPTIGTGYGVQTRHLADLLADAGHDVAISVTYGHQGPIGAWKSPSGHEIRLYPSGYETNSPDVIIGHAEHWFEGDPEAGWIILLLDTWCFARPLLMDTLRGFQVATWCPIDHFPVPRDVLTFLQRSEALPIAMSQYGAAEITKAGLDPVYIPLTVDTTTYKPTFDYEVNGKRVNARQLFDLPLEAFVVGMVAMNKGWARDRKGFNEAFRAFSLFHHDHPNAVLFLHTEKYGLAEGIDLTELAAHCGIPPHAVVFTDQYAYRIGLPPEMMAAAYTAMDVLLAPSHGEGFGVPLIEAQACGTPVIASDFSAQPELVGAGWKISGQLEWDPAQHASYMCPYTLDVLAKLEEAFHADLDAMQADAVAFAADYDTRKVFAEMWVPFLATLEPVPPVEKPKMERVDVIVPLMRPENMDRLMMSIGRDDRVKVLAVHDGLDVSGWPVESVDTRQDHTTYSVKVNTAFEHSTADFVLVVGDDVEFTDGWFEAALDCSTRYDVIGTNDSEPGRTRNPNVAAGRHADHFFIRRSYIDDEGSSLDGPGVPMPTAYRHWFTDREVIELARARGVFGFAEECRIIHHHPAYDGDEVTRRADPVYMTAIEASDEDQATWLSRAPLIEGHRVTRARR